MASGCPAVRIVHPSAPSAALATRSASAGSGGHGAGAKQGDNDRIRACSRTFRTSRTPRNCRSGGGTTSGEVGCQILATKWARPRSRRRRGQCDPTAVSHKFRLVLAEQRRRPMAPPQRSPETRVWSLHLEIHRGGLPAVLFDLILDVLPFIEGAQSRALDRRDMDKHILATALG